MKYSFDHQNHIHKLDGKPLMGCSTVVGVLAKPLTWWASGMAVGHLGWKNVKKHPKEECLQAARDKLAKIQEMTVQEYYSELCKAYRAHHDHKEDTAVEGTETHRLCENYIKMCLDTGTVLNPGDTPEIIRPFVKWALQNVREFHWSEAHCYSQKLWVGGITDAGATLKDGAMAVIDFKRSKEAYTGQFIQAAGYAIALEENGLFTHDGEPLGKLDRDIDTLVIVPFRSNPVTPSVVKGIGKFREGFRSCVQLHKLVEGIQA